MALDFPNSPTNNQSFSAGGKTWIYNGTKWVLLGVSLNQTVSDGAITESKIASNAVTTAKIAAGAVGTTDLAANAVTQAKLASNLSAVTVTTSANRGTDVASPFTGQTIYLSDVKRLQVWDGSAWMFVTNGAPGAPTSLSATALSTTSVSVAFTPGTINGASPTNYKYSLSTNGGSTYGEPIALDPADIVSPVVISGLTSGTTYHIKLRAVSDFGDSPDSTATSVTLPLLFVDYLVIAGAGGGGYDVGGGGGAGGLRSTVSATGGNGTLETALPIFSGNSYAVSVGAGGGGSSSNAPVTGSNGVASSFSSISTLGGGGGGSYSGGNGVSGGSGGGGSGYGSVTTGGAGTVNQGYAGGNGLSAYGTAATGGGGGGAGGIGAESANNNSGFSNGGSGLSISITGSPVTYAAGGRGAGDAATGTTNGTANTGRGGDGGGGANTTPPANVGGNGGSGVVILRYPDTRTITLGAGLTGSTTTISPNKVTTITAGSGNVSWT